MQARALVAATILVPLEVRALDGMSFLYLSCRCLDLWFSPAALLLLTLISAPTADLALTFVPLTIRHLVKLVSFSLTVY